MRKQIIIFDFDGTIANTLPVIKQIIIRLAYSFGFKTPTEDQMDQYRSKQYKKIIKELQIPLYKIPFLLQAGRNEMSNSIHHTNIFPGIKECIQRLINNKLTVGILTSNSKINVEIFLKKHHIPIKIIHNELNLFGKDKALDRLIKQYKWDKNQVIYIGDEVRDIEACHTVGIDVIAVSWGFNQKELLEKFNPTVIVKHPNDIYKYLSKPSCST